MSEAPRRVDYLRLDAIQRAPRNPKKHDRDGIAASIDEHGLAELPLIDERTGRLVAGHGRLGELETKHAAGEPAPDGVLVDDDGMWRMPVVRGWASKSDAHAESYLLASNQTAMRGGWHDDALNELLADLAQQDFDLATVAGWDPATLDALLAVPEVVVPPIAPPEPKPAKSAQKREPQPAAEPVAPQAEVVPEPAQPAPKPPRNTSGMVEMLLIYPADDRAEVARLIQAAKTILGPDLKSPEVILRALRTMVTVLDYRDAGPVDMARFARAAGWEA